MDKLLFLDFDGVLNAFNYNKELYMQRARAIKSGVHHTEAPPVHDCFGALFCPDCVEQLKRIITATGADIVITSTWRKAGIKEMREMWTARNLPGKIVGITPYLTDGNNQMLGTDMANSRGAEVAHFMALRTEPYCIVDDRTDFLPNQLKDHFVEVDADKGLTKRDADKVIEILNRNVADATPNNK